jgi:hypothetical protein
MQDMTSLAVDDRSAIIGSIAGCAMLFAVLLAAKFMWPDTRHAKPMANCPALEQGANCKPRLNAASAVR